MIEEKRGIIESQFKEYFYDWPGAKPQRMVGKNDENGERLVPWTGELSPRLLAPIVAKRLDAVFPGLGLAERAARLAPSDGRVIQVAGATRTPYFCSGCPHNTSTKVPEGSKALAGIGCHFMASWMDRDTTSLIQMGGEGVNWAASSKFTGRAMSSRISARAPAYHSGSMAIRQAIAAGANITYKILYNDAVAMTGGQPIDAAVGPRHRPYGARRGRRAHRARLRRARRNSRLPIPCRTTTHARGEMDALQRELREVKGVSVLIYEQTCATEKRRRRKRGTMDDPKRFAYINDLVCEGCGDCSVASNCLSVEPVETPLGRKRRINLSTCNKDFSCLKGFCPSFVTVEGATRRKRRVEAADYTERAERLPAPALPALDEPFDLLVTGVGGTGVITVGQLVTMAAHLEKKGASVLDFTGFAQKFGPVLSYIRIAGEPSALNQVRIDQGAADALIGCDLVVSSSPKASGTYRTGMRAVVNSAEMPTGDVVRNRDADLAAASRLAAIARVAGADNLATFDANRAAERLFGDTVYANVMMLGFAWQMGLVPVSLDALDRAIELNGVAVDVNRQVFAAGRIACVDPDFANPPEDRTQPETMDEMIRRRTDFLAGYQDETWAKRYRDRVEQVRQTTGDDALTEAVAKSLFKLMSYKDEYEVARLHMETGFLDRLGREFEGPYKVNYHLAPPFLSSGLDARGRPLKRQFGPWIQFPFRILAKLKWLRGTAFDPFGHTAERRMERDLIGWYEGVVETILARFESGHREALVAAAKAPMDIRGYGPVKEKAVEKVKAEVDRLLSKAG